MIRKRKTKKRIHGNDRGLMMICRDIRRRWLQYGDNRKDVKFTCTQCSVEDEHMQVDHIQPLGSRPRKWEDLGKYAKAMFERKCQALCKACHKTKTDAERKRRKKK